MQFFDRQAGAVRRKLATVPGINVVAPGKPAQASALRRATLQAEALPPARALNADPLRAEVASVLARLAAAESELAAIVDGARDAFRIMRSAGSPVARRVARVEFSEAMRRRRAVRTRIRELARERDAAVLEQLACEKWLETKQDAADRWHDPQCAEVEE